MKIQDFIEKNVQWIAMGLAVIWLLWVGWAYGVNRPHIEVNGQSFSAGNVDEHIRDNDAATLAAKIGDSNVPAGLVDVPDFTDAFVNSMNGQPPGALTAVVIASPPPYKEVVTGVEERQNPIARSVKELPKTVIPADPVAVAGRSQVVVPTEKPRILQAIANGANGAVANNDANAGRPNIFDNTTQPQTQPEPAAGAAAAAAPLPGQPAGASADRTWVTVFAKLNFNEQDSEFRKVKIPQFRMQKQYIEVQLQRQEVLPDGNFGNIEIVRGLAMNQPPVDRAKAAEFVKWSADAEAQKMILAPPFYFVVKGSSWEIPQKAGAAVAQAQPAQAFDLQQKYQEYKQLKTDLEKRKFTDGWTNEQKSAFYTYRIGEEKKENAAKAPPPNQPRQGDRQRYVPPVNRGAPGGPGRGQGDAVDPALLREMYADGDVPPPRRRGVADEGDIYMRRRQDLYRRAYGDDYMRRRQLPGNEEGMANQNQQQILGNLIPDNMGNVDIWAHDETAQPGRTYRYRVRAIIMNPLFDTKNIAVNPELEKPPYLPADLASGNLDANAAWSEWTKPIAIPGNVDMMLVSASNLGGKETAKFRVKRFQEGQINEAPRPFEVSPGDTIGGKEKVNVQAPGAANNVGVAVNKQIEVDFTTNWMLVDIRQTGNDYRVRIMDPQGRMEVRTVIGDRNKFKDDAKPVGGAVGLARPN